MKIDKAIELLNDEAHSPRYKFDPDGVAAFQLGIEALHRCKEIKKYSAKDSYCPLPGETKD